MNIGATELLVIVGGAVLGWIIVSRVMSAGGPPTPDLDANAPWHKLLRVSNDADGDAIEAAYQQRLAELEASLPTIPTLPEQSAHHERKQILQKARDLGLSQASH